MEQNKNIPPYIEPPYQNYRESDGALLIGGVFGLIAQGYSGTHPRSTTSVTARRLEASRITKGTNANVSTLPGVKRPEYSDSTSIRGYEAVTLANAAREIAQAGENSSVVMTSESGVVLTKPEALALPDTHQ